MTTYIAPAVGGQSYSLLLDGKLVSVHATIAEAIKATEKLIKAGAGNS